ncbi:MAG: T9SS type A sorting domain-containing protein [Flavobacteriales bacterium]|nr:T9SS type A sorting domain-containing protein [Flavobacteriales bacterium]
MYFGVGPEQMADAATGRMMIQLSHDWFYGTVGVSEFDAAIGSMGQAYPVPADGWLTIPVSGLQDNATLEVFDATGRSVFEQNTSNNAGKIILNTSGLSDGLYSYRLRTANSTDTARSFVVSH